MATMLDGRARLEGPLSGLMEANQPVLSADEPVQAARRILTSVHALLVEEKGVISGLLSRIDLIGYVAR